MITIYACYSLGIIVMIVIARVNVYVCYSRGMIVIARVNVYVCYSRGMIVIARINVYV